MDDIRVLQKVFELISDERYRQNRKWGVQTHEDFVWLAILTEEVGEVSEAILHDRFGGNAAGTVFEELLHTVSVGVQWMEYLLKKQTYESSYKDGFLSGVEETEE